jgi:hypothetical protein
MNFFEDHKVDLYDFYDHIVYNLHKEQRGGRYQYL